MITRSLTVRLLEGLAFFPAVGIIGPRQVGKTTLVKQIREQISKDSLYLDLELPSDAQKLADAETLLGQYQNTCVILDEIQRMPQLFPVLHALIDQQRQPARFILFGSASPDLLRDSSESLAGRISYLELMPFRGPKSCSSAHSNRTGSKADFPKPIWPHDCP